MTACNNNVRGGKASRVITAALVATLSVGTPMAAIASTVSEGGVDMLAGTAADQFSLGTVTLSDDAEPYTGSAFTPSVTKVTLKDGTTEITNIANNDDYLIYYVKADAKGEPSTEKISKPVEVGTYYVAVEAVDGDYAGAIAYGKFNITGVASFGTVGAYSDKGCTSTAFTYDAESADVYFKNGAGTPLVENKDYTVKYYKVGEDYNNASAGSTTAPTDAGQYFARLTGINGYAGQATNVTFTINALDLSTADVYVETVIGKNSVLPTQPTLVNGSEKLASELKLVYGTAAGDCRNYTPSVKPAVEDDSNFTSTGRADFDKVETAASFTYDGAAVPSDFTIDLSADEEFDASKLKVTYVDDGENEPVNAASSIFTPEDGKYSVKVLDAEGNDISATLSASITTLSDLAAYLNNADHAGTYTIIFTATPNADYYYGGSATMKITVSGGTIDCDKSLFVQYDGKYVTSIEATYDGSAVNPTNVTLYDEKVNTVIPSSDYELVYKNADGEKIAPSDVKDAGDYTLEVTSTKYNLVNNKISIKIKKATVAAIRIPSPEDKVSSESGKTQLTAVNGQYALEYDEGNAIAPQFQVTDGVRDEDGKLSWVNASTLPYIEATITKDGKKVSAVKDAGNYVVTFALANESDSKNYDVTTDGYEFSVVESLGFLDVPSDSYYYDAIMTATDANHGYMNGYSKKFFGPDDQITRAQAAIVFYNMAGETFPMDDSTYSQELGWKTGFSDVDGKAYYAKAVAWAEKTGIVTGYGDTGTFGPEDNITREQFAIMLSRYAKLCGNYDAVDTEAVLAKYADGDTVSDYAADAVAWAADNGYIGNGSGLMPSDSIIRGQVAIIAVRYQPAKLA